MIHNGEAIGVAPNITDAQVISQIKVLNAIAFLWCDKKESKVGDLLELASIASPATIHAALKKLTKKNLNSMTAFVNAMAMNIALVNLNIT